jgi:dihydroneopterin aldolase
MKISLNSLPVFIKLGYFENERLLGQDVNIDLDLYLYDRLAPGISDDLTKTVDYGDVVKTIDDAVRGREIRLIETVVELVGVAILEEYSLIEKAFVSVTKAVIPQNVVRGAKVSVSKEFSRHVKR